LKSHGEPFCAVSFYCMLMTYPNILFYCIMWMEALGSSTWQRNIG
jgi:hypothetical protein